MFSMDAEVAIFYDEGFLDAHHDALLPLFNEYAEDVEHEINSRTSDLFQRWKEQLNSVVEIQAKPEIVPKS